MDIRCNISDSSVFNKNDHKQLIFIQVNDICAILPA